MQFFIKNLSFYTKEWLEFLKTEDVDGEREAYKKKRLTNHTFEIY